MSRFKRDVEKEPNSNFCHRCRKWVVTPAPPEKFDKVWTCRECKDDRTYA